jgi:hypothetical protein
MCDPVTATLISTGVSAATAIGGTLMQLQRNSDVQAEQTAANQQWVNYQNQIHTQQAQEQDQARNAANAARVQTLNNVSPQNLETEQGNEQSRLNTAYTSSVPNTADPNAVASLALSGQNTGDKPFMTSLTNQVNQATSQARGRIAALATANSYGGSQFGLGTQVPITFQQGANAINLQNARRQSDISTYGVQQQVQPLNYVLGPNYNLPGQIGGIGAGVAGKGLGTLLAGAGNSPTQGLMTSQQIGGPSGMAGMNLDWS